MIRTVFFDAVGTLLHVKGSVGAHYAQVARAWGVEAEAMALDAAFRQVYRCTPALIFREDADYSHQEKQWWQQLVWQVFHKVGALPSDFTGYFEAVYAHFATAEAWTLYPETELVLQALQSDYTLGIISNFDARLLTVLEQLGIAQYFQSVTLSGQVGVSKPQAAIFQQALAGAQPQTALHVGDSRTADYEGPLAVGMAALWLNRAAEPSSSLRDLTAVVSWLQANAGRGTDPGDQ
ncbi:MAG: HAD-IA family hydrolase [Synechococcaceae cyanobacterium SM2_3_60]|nr:HAD-IA family hydrolase [Synechococcaceae cyanobacterium SM2_3_60]